MDIKRYKVKQYWGILPYIQPTTQEISLKHTNNLKNIEHHTF